MVRADDSVTGMADRDAAANRKHKFSRVGVFSPSAGTRAIAHSGSDIFRSGVATAVATTTERKSRSVVVGSFVSLLNARFRRAEGRPRNTGFPPGRVVDALAIAVLLGDLDELSFSAPRSTSDPFESSSRARSSVRS